MHASGAYFEVDVIKPVTTCAMMLTTWITTLHMLRREVCARETPMKVIRDETPPPRYAHRSTYLLDKARRGGGSNCSFRRPF